MKAGSMHLNELKLVPEVTRVVGLSELVDGAG